LTFWHKLPRTALREINAIHADARSTDNPDGSMAALSAKPPFGAT
jgi:hypothetical protein